MREGHIAIYYGEGKGKTSIAVGRGMRAIGEDLRVVMIQFLDYHNSKETALLKKMEPDFRVFRFEKEREGMDVREGELDENLKKEIGSEIRNAFNFAKKIVDTGECEMTKKTQTAAEKQKSCTDSGGTWSKNTCKCKKRKANN